MNRSSWICVGLIIASVVYLAVVDRPEPFVGVLVGPELEIDSVLVEEVFQPEQVHDRETLADDALAESAVVSIVVAAVHGPVTHGYDPWPLGSVLGLRRLFEIFFEPLVLVCDLCDPVFDEKVELSGEADDMSGPQVEAKEVVVYIAALVHHAEPIDVVGEVVAVLMVADAGHVRNVRRHGLDLAHEFIPNTSVVRIHIVREITHVENSIDGPFLGLLLEERKGLGVHVAHVSEHGQPRAPLLTTPHGPEEKQGAPAHVGTTVVPVQGAGLEAGQGNPVYEDDSAFGPAVLELGAVAQCPLVKTRLSKLYHRLFSRVDSGPRDDHLGRVHSVGQMNLLGFHIDNATHHRLHHKGQENHTDGLDDSECHFAEVRRFEARATHVAATVRAAFRDG
uniref:Putative secreted protein n=1 Tax=Ixodes ricinus TaxID=34613 RepID=A0A6B0V9G6_IXORI